MLEKKKAGKFQPSFFASINLIILSFFILTLSKLFFDLNGECMSLLFLLLLLWLLAIFYFKIIDVKSDYILPYGIFFI